MADTRGPLTQLNNRLPDGLDANRLAQWQLRDGRTYDQFRSDVAGALIALNQEILTAWGDLVYITDEDHFEYPTGGALEDMPDITDNDLADLYKGETVGHMLDLTPKGRGIGGHWRFFRDVRESRLRADISGIVTSGRNTFEKGVLNRIFNNAANSLGTSGYDVPFANGSATGPTYTPPSWGGNDFSSTHNHYVAIDTTGTDFSNLLEDLAADLKHHGHSGPFTAKVSETDVASYTVLPKFSRPISERIEIIDRGGDTTGNQFFERGVMETPQMSGAGYYIGTYVSDYGEIRLYASSRIPTGYAAIYRSYGNNDARNPIGVRIHPTQGFGFFINEIASSNNQFPVARIQIEIEYGISCGMDRTNGVVGLRVGGGAWANATIT